MLKVAAFNKVLTTGVAQQLAYDEIWSSDTSILDTLTLSAGDKFVRMKSSGQFWCSFKVEGYTGVITGLSGYVLPVTFTFADALNGYIIAFQTQIDGSKKAGGWLNGFTTATAASPATFSIWLYQASGGNQTVSTATLVINWLGSPTSVTQYV